MRIAGRAITTPFWDGLLTGGLSLAAMGVLLFYVLVLGRPIAFDTRDWIALTILVNSPHFMASYRLLYDSREHILAHPWATLVVPTGLVGVVLAVTLVERPGPLLGWLVLVSSVYLAWHYAGQTWGMVASFGHLEGITFTPRERFLLRTGPRVLLALHVLFAMTGRLPPRSWIDPQTYVSGFAIVFQLVCGLIVVGLLLGVWTFVALRRRHGELPIRVVLPWAALYLWYPFWYFVPGGFFFVQIAHALQYMAFPLRVEVNRYAKGRTRSPSQRRLHAGLVYVGLVVLGAVVLHGPPLTTHALGEGWYSTDEVRRSLLAVTHCVGIHHYFVDGAIWRLRDRRVREELFSHLETESEAR